MFKIGVLVGLCMVLIVNIACATPIEDKSSPKYWADKGLDLYNQSKYDLAARYFDAAIKLENKTLDPNYYIWTLHLRGCAYLMAGDYEKADRDLLNAANAENLIDNITASEYYLEAAAANFMVGYANPAYGMLINSAIRANPNNALAWHMKGVAIMYATKPNYTQAAECFSKARKLGYKGEVCPEEEEAIEKTTPLE